MSLAITRKVSYLTQLNPGTYEVKIVPVASGWPEVGSRAMQRMGVAFSAPGISPWIAVQPEQYRYLAIAEGAVMIRIVISEYLACEVIWE